MIIVELSNPAITFQLELLRGLLYLGFPSQYIRLILDNFSYARIHKTANAPIIGEQKLVKISDAGAKPIVFCPAELACYVKLIINPFTEQIEQIGQALF